MKVIKLIVLTMTLFCYATTAQSQNSSLSSNTASSAAADACRLALTPYLPNNVGSLTEEARSILENQLNQITTKNGIGGSSINKQFIITANVLESTKDISATTPVIYSFGLEVIFYIGDGISGVKFASLALSAKGSANSETKAYIKALKEIKPYDPVFKKFIDEGKAKIIEYYRTNADVIIAEANALSSQNKFDEAIYKLVCVPNICKEAYDKCLNKIPEIYKAKMERECQKLLAESKVFISQDNYLSAAKVLSPLLPDLSCYPEVATVLQQITDHKAALLLAEAQGAWANKDIAKASAALSQIAADSKYHEDAIKLADEFCTLYLSEARGAWANSDIAKASAALAQINSGSKCNADAEKIADEFCTLYLSEARGAWANSDIKKASAALAKIKSGSKCNADAEKLAAEFCTLYLSEAKGAWANSDIEKASAYLGKINSGSKCNADAEKLTEEFCTVYLGKARGAWAEKNIESTSSYLMNVRSGTKCYTEALAIGEEVKKWVKEKDGREWDLAKEKDKREFDLKAKEQQDNTDLAKGAQQFSSEQAKREYEMRVLEQKDRTDLAKARIPAELEKQRREADIVKASVQKSQEVALSYAATMSALAYNTANFYK